ncbi:CPBP family intramembrane metalloprotease [Oculatella sp. LEGE 06141]|uniref:CPBP family glutamic-type intramembrane protease n=1 Tax=Oculatella sp. LEGE 06141 TaxID=1828648 RepID=UPI00187F2E1C|nr:CPBP family intramembrane metalloprotease [Oculatella sp. LEGE 06141]
MTEQLPNQPQVEPLSRVQILAAMGLTAVVLLLVARAWMVLDAVALLSVNWVWTDLLLGAAIGLGITGASSIVYRLWESYRRSADFYLALILKPLTWTDLIWLGLLPGLSEELLFRGVMLPALGFNLLAVIISSVCFGVLHFSGSQQLPYVIWATVIGAVLGVSALATGNLMVPILAHVTTNLVSGLMWKFDR